MATKDQNPRLPILLRGINRRPADSTDDGSLLDLINLRFTNDALRPVSPKTRYVQPTPQYRILYKHIISENKYALWGIRYSTPTYYLAFTIYDDGVATSEELSYKTVSGYDVVFSSLGNSLIVSDRVAEVSYMALYDHDDDDYSDYGIDAPAMPFVTFQNVVRSGDDEETRVDSLESAEFDEINDRFYDKTQVMIGQKQEKGYLTGHYVVRACWELFDGTLVQHTVPTWLSMSDIQGYTISAGGGSIKEIWLLFIGYALQYKLNMSTSDLTAFKNKYEGIVISFNLYISNTNPPVRYYDWGGGTGEWPHNTPRSVVVKNGFTTTDAHYVVKEMVNFFELVKVPLSELAADSWITPDIMPDTSRISSQLLMTPGNLAAHQLYGDILYTYNKRVFLGNIMNHLFPGMTLDRLMYEGSWNCNGPAYSIGLSFDIDTPHGTKRVFSGWIACNFYRSKFVPGESYTDADKYSANTIGKTGAGWTVNEWAGYVVVITSGTGSGQWRQIVSNTADTLVVATNWTVTPNSTSDFSVTEPDYFQFDLIAYIHYPDYRAKAVQLWHKDGGGTIRRLYNKNLTQNIALNYSFAMSINLFPFDTGMGMAKIAQPLTEWTVMPINEDSTYWDSDRIQACEFNNPFYYPAGNSYRVDGFVLGLASNAIPLGASQFGQYPLFAFTTKGIWALSIGTGEVLIETVKPMSDVICTNKNSILGIEGGVIFMANEGLIILSGSNAAGISDMIIGEPVSPLTGLLDYDRCINNPNTYQPKAFIDTIPFRTYADGAIIAYSTLVVPTGTPQKEIIISNPLYNYSYVFNMNSKSWYKITQSWDSFIHDYPKTFGTKFVTDTFHLDDLTSEVQNPDQEILIHIETRPIKFGEEISFKKIRRTILYGWINMDVERLFSIFLFGTVDKEHWTVQSSGQIISPGQQVVMGRTLFSCRSFIIVLGGYVKENSYIQGLIADIEKRYNDKLR
jgi:hypothetical protein